MDVIEKQVADKLDSLGIHYEYREHYDIEFDFWLPEFRVHIAVLTSTDAYNAKQKNILFLPTIEDVKKFVELAEYPY